MIHFCTAYLQQGAHDLMELRYVFVLSHHVHQRRYSLQGRSTNNGFRIIQGLKCHLNAIQTPCVQSRGYFRTGPVNMAVHRIITLLSKDSEPTRAVKRALTSKRPRQFWEAEKCGAPRLSVCTYLHYCIHMRLQAQLPNDLGYRAENRNRSFSMLRQWRLAALVEEA